MEVSLDLRLSWIFKTECTRAPWETGAVQRRRDGGRYQKILKMGGKNSLKSTKTDITFPEPRGREQTVILLDKPTTV